MSDIERLMRPSQKTITRTQRLAIMKYCASHDPHLNFIDVESWFGLTRGTLADLLHHTFYVGGIQPKAEELVKVSQMFITTKGARTCFSSEERWQGFLERHRYLEREVKRAREWWAIKEKHLQAFLAIVGIWRDTLIEEGYKPYEIVPQEMVALADMAARNFQTYDATMNAIIP